jgi:hypothetical protein
MSLTSELVQEIRRGETTGNHQARQILAALGISAREPAPDSSIILKSPLGDKVKFRCLICNDLQS